MFVCHADKGAIKSQEEDGQHTIAELKRFFTQHHQMSAISVTALLDFIFWLAEQ